MLDVERIAAPPQSATEYKFAPQLDALGLLRIVYRQWPYIAACTALMLILGLVYQFTATPKYTTNFLIYIEPNKGHSLAKQEIAMNGPADPALFESQVEILKSDSVALAAVRKLRKEGKEVLIPEPSILAKAATFVFSLLPNSLAPTPPTEDDKDRVAADVLSNGVKAKRLGVTYVIEVDYTSLSAQAAADGANAIADAYIDGELDAKYQATRRASLWLQDRIKELREQASTADQRVQEYKSANGIIDTSRGSMNEQSLADVSTQLGSARAMTAEAKARLDRVVEISRGDIVDGAISDALKSDIITRLRAQYLDLATKRAEIAAKYGRDHGAAINLQNQMTSIKRAMQAELSRIMESSRSEYEIDLAREKNLQKDLDSLVEENSEKGKAQVELRDLESSSQTYRNLYDTFFQKFEEAVQQQSFPVSDARIITSAIPPERPSWPKLIVVFPAALFLGMMLGFGVALFREFLGNNFRIVDDVANYAGFECLGILPNLAFEPNAKKAPPPTAGLLGSSTPFLRQSVNAPFSRFTETLRNVKVSIDIARAQEKSGVIGIVSSVPREGKTTFAVNLALLIAQMGHKTLLIDGDLHNPSMSRHLAPNCKNGLLELLTTGRNSPRLWSRTQPRASSSSRFAPRRATPTPSPR